jgi:membrane protease YdiL (CAAX protease family)
LDPQAIQNFGGLTAAVILLGLFGLGLGLQSYVVYHVASSGGRVRAGEFRAPDAFVAIWVAMIFAGLTILNQAYRAKHGDAAIKPEHILPGSLPNIFLAIIGAAALRYRGHHLVPLFGLNRISPGRVIGWIGGLFIAALALASITAVFSFLILRALDAPVAPQALVTLFSEVVQKNNWRAMSQIFLAAVVVAPICEELLFRGIFYAVGKRFLGPVASGACTALFFAACHLSLSSFAGLFVLALCLTFAYERTGSLLVPIGMHALFNFANLCMLYFYADRMIPSS